MVTLPCDTQKPGAELNGRQRPILGQGTERAHLQQLWSQYGSKAYSLEPGKSRACQIDTWFHWQSVALLTQSALPCACLNRAHLAAILVTYYVWRPILLGLMVSARRAGERALGLAPEGVSCYYSPGMQKAEIDAVQVRSRPLS